MIVQVVLDELVVLLRYPQEESGRSFRRDRFSVEAFGAEKHADEVDVVFRKEGNDDAGRE